MAGTNPPRRCCCWLTGLACLAFGGLSQAEPVEVNANEPVLDAWRQRNFGGASPELVRQADGSTTITWNGSVTADHYYNSSRSASGSMNTPMLNGAFNKAVVQSDLRGIGANGQTSYFQLGWTASDDRAVLSQHPRQINNFQLGRNGQDYLMALGDVMPNFSSLGSSLGLRGLIGQTKLGDVTVYGYAGIVAQSWESLGGTTPRNQFLRDVFGGKLEYQLLPSLRVYATLQSGTDRAGSLPAGTSYAAPLSIRSASGGFQYAEGAFQLNGEYAHGGSQALDQERNSGDALILDATWRLGKWSLRGGYHDIDPGFATLSGMVQAGISETYLNADWTAASWLSLGSDLRVSRNRTLATALTPSATTLNESNALRANINFGPHLPGWAVALQKSDSRQRDPLDQQTRNIQSSASLNYASPKITASLGYGSGQSRNRAMPDYNSENTSWQLNLGRTYSDATPTSAPNWSLNLNFSGAIQKQAMAVGSSTGSYNYTLSVNGQRNGWGNLQLSFTEGYSTQPYGGPELKQRGLQLEAAHPLTSATAKLYLRDNQRNIGDAVLAARETASGVQLLAPF